MLCLLAVRYCHFRCSQRDSGEESGNFEASGKGEIVEGDRRSVGLDCELVRPVMVSQYQVDKRTAGH